MSVQFVYCRTDRIRWYVYGDVARPGKASSSYIVGAGLAPALEAFRLATKQAFATLLRLQRLPRPGKVALEAL